MKKLFSFIAIFLTFSLYAFAGSFPDVAEDHKNFAAIEYLDEKEVVNGYLDGTFKPEIKVTRAEAAKMIRQAFGIKHDEDYEEIFSDAKKGDWFFEDVMALQKEGVVVGHEDRSFKPNDSVNLAETLKMVLMAAKINLPATVSGKVFLDVESDLWYAPHALFARNYNIVMSDESGKLKANEPMTRATFAEILYRVLKVRENDDNPFPLHTNWPIYSANDLPFKMKYDDLGGWKVIENEKEVTFWYSDKNLAQFSPKRVYPNSAYVTVTIDENEKKFASENYFKNLKEAFIDATYTRFKFANFEAMEILYPKDRIVDWYIYLDDGRVITLYTEFGHGASGYKLQQIIKSMFTTLEYTAAVVQEKPDYSELLNEIFGNILVEGTGMNMINKLPDKIIIETDVIGVGTGPIDYYYSSGLDITFKYERDGDVILDKREGKTSTF
ncbi:S-layer homology domain-containing protein [Candidatus Peregrinibacteria bacterium]|nr:S-layer homology domain-containing protein [Candidatus Peregrinibacteria bacterium]